MKTDSDILDRLGTLPHKLAALYLETYNDRLAPNSGAAAKLIQNTFHWLLCAPRSFKSDSFLVVISQLISKVAETMTRDQLLDLCCNFVIHDDKLDVFRFAHLSVQEFLETLPQFLTTTSHSLIAEHCLAYILSRADSPAIQQFLADHYSLPDPYSLRDHEYIMRGFQVYAFYEGLKHCKQAGVKRTQGSLQTLLHMLFLDERGASSLLDFRAWVRGRTNKFSLMVMLRKLREGAVTKPENNLQGAFLIACLFGFPEIISQYLQSILPPEVMAKGLLLATDKENEDVIAELKLKSRTVFTADVLRHALRELETEASEYQQLLPLFLDGGEHVLITKKVVRWACGSFGRMALLVLCHPRSLDETETLLVTAASNHDSRLLELLLRHIKTARVKESMIESAATSTNLHTLLRQPFVTSSVMKSALRNQICDKRSMELIESRVGRIHANIDVLKEVLACRDSWVWEEILLRRGAQVTEDSIVLVAQRKWMPEESVRLHLMGNITVQLSQELVERVMGLDSGVWVMEVLLHHLTPAFKLTENLMLRAMYLDRRGYLVFLLLAKDPTFRITESLIERTISSPQIRGPYLERLLVHDLLEHGGSFRISDQLVKQSILQISKETGGLYRDIISLFETTPRVTEEDLRPMKLLLDHDPQFRITSDLLDQLEWCHRPSEEVMDVLWARLVSDGNLEEVISEGFKRYRQDEKEHGSLTRLLLRQDRAHDRNVTPVSSGE